MAEAGGAWQAFARATRELSPEAVVHTVAESGLRGLGARARVLFLWNFLLSKITMNGPQAMDGLESLIFRR